MSVTHVLILPDIHLPYEDKRSVGAVLNYAATKHWDECVQLGDFVDMNSVSSHNKGKPLLVEGERLADDYEYANEFLDCLTQAVRAKNPKCKITLLKGNHEYRVDRYVEEHPALEGMIETKVGLRLKERGIQQINCYPGGELYKIGKLTFTHGYWCNEHHAKKHADYYGCSIVYGHCFDEQTEILTNKGWRRREQLSLGDQVMTLNQASQRLEWNPIKSFSDYSDYTEMHSIVGNNVDLLVTDRHGLVGLHDNGSLDLYEARAFDEYAVRRFICAGEQDREGLPLTDDQIRLAVWIAADGSLENVGFGNNAVRWHLKKPRKIARLRELLKRLELNYSLNPQKAGTTKIYCNLGASPVRELFTWGAKVLPDCFRFLSTAQVRVLIEEYGHTDGHIYDDNSVQIATSKRAEADLIQELAVRSGMRCTLNDRGEGKGFTLAVSRNRTTVQMRPDRHVVVPYSGKVWCVTVDNGTLMVRRNGKVCITQNTHTVQEFSKVLHGPDSTIIGLSLGTLSTYQFPYLEGRPSAWQHAFGEAHFQENGFFNTYPIRIFDGGFVSPDGHVCTYREPVKGKR